MTNKDLKEKLNSAETSSEKKGIIESMRDDIVNAAKAKCDLRSNGLTTMRH